MRRIALLVAVLVLSGPVAGDPSCKIQMKNCAQAATAETNQVSQSSGDDRLDNYTLWLTVFTGLLVIVSCVQGYLILRTDRTARAAADAARKSADVAEAAYLNLESPYLFPVVDASEFMRSLQFGPGSPVSPVEIRLRNMGRSPGFPAVLACELVAGGPDEVVNDREAGWFPDSTLAPGETSANLVKRGIRNITDQDCSAIVKGAQDVYLCGKVFYMDLFGRQYRQTFCLKWLSSHGSFMAFGPARNKRDLIKNGAELVN